MQLSPEERKRVYEEEKSRIEAEEKQRKESSTTSLSPNTAALLCYVGGWISGIVFLIIEQKNKFVRFHAAQSVIAFGALSIIHSFLSSIPFAGRFFSVVIGIFTFILWIILMVKASHGELFKLPAAGDLAERLLGLPSGQAWEDRTGAPGTETASVEAAIDSAGKKIQEKLNQWQRGRAGRIAGSALAIAWSFAWLIFFNFFNQYIAFYNMDTTGNIWMREPMLTEAFSEWLPIVTAALLFSMAGHILLIAIDKYALREAVQIVLDIFGIVVITSLLSIFPFNFSAFPEPAAAVGIEFGIRITLGIVAFGIAIGVIVRFIKLTVNLIRGTNSR